MNIKCEICDKEFYIRPAHFKRRAHHYCGRDCYNMGQTKTIVYNCQNCGCEITRTGSESEKKYCSVECKREAFKSRIIRIDTKCFYCGTDIKLKPCKIKERNFCCVNCKNRQHSLDMSQEGNSNWKGGLSNEPYPLKFKKDLKKIILDRDNHKCVLCGKDASENYCGNGFNLSVHHIDYNKNNLDYYNLISLCNSCHAKTNYNRDLWTNLLSNLLKK